ncbi:MAG: LPS export ABC transporter permease LptF [Bdellovibrionales bacterium]|nr:LPS export ABC transporter permease LptF [Bdellovibrionales bacterium]
MPTRTTSGGAWKARITRWIGRPVPWTIYRYVLSEVSRPFLGAAIFFLFVLLMFQVVRLADFFVVHNVSGFSILSLMGYLSLTFVPVIIPIAFLLAVLVGFGRLSTDAEVTAMRAAGISVYTLLAPVFLLSVVVMVVNLAANAYFVPYGSRSFRYELFRISNTKAIATIHEGTFTEGFFDLVLYADKVNSRDSSMERVLIYDERSKESPPVTVVAKSGRILSNFQDTRGIPGLVMRLFDGALHRGSRATGVYEMTEFSRFDIFLPIETAKVVGVEQPKTMDMGALVDGIRIHKERMLVPPGLMEWEKKELRDYRIEYWKRIVLSAACVFFAILGVAFGVVKTRTVRSNSFIICLLVLLAYWGVYQAGYSLADTGKISPILGMWAANALLLVVGVAMLRRVAR